MKDKYYTPTIEEFHVGFEFEYRNSTDKTWYKQIFNRGIGFALNPTVEDCRVKYLDKEDIESLGFKQTDKVNSSVYNKENVTIWLGDSTKGMFTAIKKVDRIRVVGITELFCGDIKNKSELKRLLKQLNI